MKEEKTVKWSEVKYKIWIKQKIESAKAKCKAAGNWIAAHPAEAVAIAGAAVGIARKTSNAYCAHREDVRRTKEYWDPRSGSYAKISRKLKPAEQVRVAERYSNGESYKQIFWDMGLLK